MAILLSIFNAVGKAQGIIIEDLTSLIENNPGFFAYLLEAAIILAAVKILRMAFSPPPPPPPETQSVTISIPKPEEPSPAPSPVLPYIIGAAIFLILCVSVLGSA